MKNEIYDIEIIKAIKQMCNTQQCIKIIAGLIVI
jgi:hypothetical protein